MQIGKIIFLFVVISVFVYPGDIEKLYNEYKNLNYKQYTELIEDIEMGTVGHNSAVLYSAIYYDIRYIYAVKHPYQMLPLAKKALKDSDVNEELKSRIIDTLQCLKEKDYIDLGYEFLNNPEYDKKTLNAYLSIGGQWGSILYENYKKPYIEKLLIDIKHKVNDKDTKWSIEHIFSGQAKDHLWYQQLEQHKPQEWYPFKLCY